MVVFSVLLLICTLPALLVTLLTPIGKGGQIPANAALINKIWTEVFDGIITGIGVWWLWFFNTRTVKEQFRSVGAGTSSEAVPLPPGRPLSISIIGWLMVITSCIAAPFLFLHFPFLFLGMLLTGGKASLVMLAWSRGAGRGGHWLAAAAAAMGTNSQHLLLCVWIFQRSGDVSASGRGGPARSNDQIRPGSHGSADKPATNGDGRFDVGGGYCGSDDRCDRAMVRRHTQESLFGFTCRTAQPL